VTISAGACVGVAPPPQAAKAMLATSSRLQKAHNGLRFIFSSSSGDVRGLHEGIAVEDPACLDADWFLVVALHPLSLVTKSERSFGGL